MAERSKARVCGRSLAGVAGSNPAGGMDVCVVCCKYNQNTERNIRMKYRVPVQIGPGAHPASCTTGTVSPSRG